MQSTLQVDTAPRELLTVRQFAERRPAWTESALRNMILNAQDRFNSRGERIPGNGLERAGAILRLGRRVLIDEQAFYIWIEWQRRNSSKTARPAPGAPEHQAA